MFSLVSSKFLAMRNITLYSVYSKIVVFSEGKVWLSGSKQGWQPRGRWFESSWGQSLFVGGNVRLGYVRLGRRDWEGATSFFKN